MSSTEKYKIYMLGAVSGEDGPKTRDLRASMGDTIKDLGHTLLSPHVAYDYEQTAFRDSVGGLDGICEANHKLMDDANLFVGEASGASDGRGYEVGYGLWKREVPVILLRHERWKRGTNMYFGNDHPLLLVSLYSEETLRQHLEGSFQEVPFMIRKHLRAKEAR